MANALVDFLEAYPAHCEYEETWPLEPGVPLRARLCLGTELPPAEVRSSILGIVFRGENEVLFFHPETPSGDIAHFIIGGRPEAGETPEETLIRELGEESGWRVRPRSIVGFRHFRHLGPLTAAMADRPYPDFLQPIYAATAETYDGALVLPGEWPCALVDVGWAVEMTRPDHRPLLTAALTVIRASLG